MSPPCQARPEAPRWRWAPTIDPQFARAESSPRFFWTRHVPVVAAVAALCWLPQVRQSTGVAPLVVCVLAVVHLLQYAVTSVYGGLYRSRPVLASILATTTNLAVSAAVPAATGRPQTLAWLLYLMYPVLAGEACGRSILLAVEVLAMPLAVAFAWSALGAVPLEQSAMPALLVAGAAEAAYLMAAVAGDSARAFRQERDGLARASAVAELRRGAARQLHSTLGAALTEVALWLQVASASSGEEARAAAARARSRAHRAVGELQASIGSLAAAEVTAAALEQILRARLQSLCEAAGATLRLEIEQTAAALPAERSWNVVRFVEEAALNAVRHARPREVRVVVRLAPRLAIEVRDDGVGFQPGSAAPGRGLTSLAEHAAALGGEPVVESAPGKGTRVALKGALLEPADSLEVSSAR